ncbi:hypothetical protein Ciccas_003188 [Cichlidogyrus casuarinus]|uniref:Uncharacterized protein n=1 Tax=Cichlidogyrus casuarinus TaxID=1844966 RepID=A0ABD2QFA0_9PLAT
MQSSRREATLARIKDTLESNSGAKTTEEVTGEDSNNNLIADVISQSVKRDLLTENKNCPISSRLHTHVNDSAISPVTHLEREQKSPGDTNSEQMNESQNEQNPEDASKEDKSNLDETMSVDQMIQYIKTEESVVVDSIKEIKSRDQSHDSINIQSEMISSKLCNIILANKGVIEIEVQRCANSNGPERNMNEEVEHELHGASEKEENIACFDTSSPPSVSLGKMEIPLSKNDVIAPRNERDFVELESRNEESATPIVIVWFPKGIHFEKIESLSLVNCKQIGNFDALERIENLKVADFSVSFP